MANDNKRLKLGDLALNLGVSTATISLALRDSPLVAEKTRKRVKDYAEEVGYIYDRSAASLRTSRSNMIGVAVHDIQNPYFAEVFYGLEEALSEDDKTILICNHRDLVDKQDKFVGTMLQHRVDGLILCPSIGTTAKSLNKVIANGVPMTLVCREVEGANAPCVRGDDYFGSYSITKHLIEQGHRRIAMLGGRRKSSPGRDRNRGWRDALIEAGINPADQIDVPELMTQTDGQNAVKDLLAAQNRPTAVMCFNDLVALGVMSASRRLGIEPGPDLAITGYDDTQGVENRTPALTTVDNGAFEIGQVAAQMMLRQLRGEASPSGETHMIQPSLQIRESAPAFGTRLAPLVNI
ncbi:LacI family DNA-binding transcriptional regulator [Flexibacterium corallicola]|uniref:LacI family DNA-binding transcriptional regulator n=1 Tax=Flexibacterium corallicola TaxID=3037259 RepID=UPI00286F8A01|nr:LacI family DNA-binding transcriptional regulator [Pseudovibrio sp. M1P-2-3]